MVKDLQEATRHMTSKKKIPTAKKKASAKKAPAKKPAAKSEVAAEPKKPAAPRPSTTFKEIKGWADCQRKVVKVWHRALGEKQFHKAKVLAVNIAEGTLLVSVATEGHKGRFLLPIDSVVGKVK